MERQLAGTVEADDLYHTAGQKGQAKQGGKNPRGRRPRGRRKKREPGRGHYDKDRPAIIAWVSRQGAVVLHATRGHVAPLGDQTADREAPVGIEIIHHLVVALHSGELLDDVGQMRGEVLTGARLTQIPDDLTRGDDK